MEEWKSIQYTPTPLSPPARTIWHPPPEGIVKVNFDGALAPGRRKAGIGVVSRDHKGELMMTMSKEVKDVVDSEIIETVAAKEAIDLALMSGFHSIILEGDALSVINAINSKDTNYSPIGVLILEIQQRLGSFSSVSVKHTKRDGNKAAHVAGQISFSISDMLVWVEETPAFLCNTLLSDRISLLS